MIAANNSIPSSEELRLVSKTLSETLQSTELSLPDMHCGACISRINSNKETCSLMLIFALWRCPDLPPVM